MSDLLEAYGSESVHYSVCSRGIQNLVVKHRLRRFNILAPRGILVVEVRPVASALALRINKASISLPFIFT